MSIGQRIAQKRKELGLSQEALGEELGVSRQAIYKWESDGAVPEVEKLVQLSRRFGVSVGWLLGVEDEPPEGAESAGGELNEQQLKMVEEIVARYLAAQEKPAEAPAKPKHRWLKVLAAVVLVVAGWSLFSRLSQLDQQYSNLQNSVNQVYSSMSGQIGSISNRVEEVLMEQNRLTADYGAEEMDADYAAGTIRFAVYAVPKTYVPGMRAEFLAESGGETVTLPCDGAERQRFSGEISCALTDDIRLSVVFIRPDGTRETQLLEQYTYRLSGSYPTVQVNSPWFFGEELTDGALRIEDGYGEFWVECGEAYSGDAAVASLQVGIFRNQKLVAWAEPCEQPTSYRGDFGENSFFFRLPELTLPLEQGDSMEIAALVTDSYGRRFMAADIPFAVEKGDSEDPLYLTYPADGTYSSDVSDWTLE